MIFFQKVKEIRSKAGHLHFERYALFQTSYLSLYVHRIHRADQDPHLHSHPWNFITVVLSGAYWARGQATTSLKYPGCFSWLNREGFHKIDEVVDGPVTTLFLAYGKRKPWYYLMDDGTRLLSSVYREKRNHKPKEKR